MAKNQTHPGPNGRNRTSQNGDGHLIDLREVVKTFQTAAGEFTALEDINLQVEAGEYVGVVGKSGSGKSTLINMITGIDKPTSGEVLVGGQPVHNLSEGKTAEWRGRHVGIIFQFFQLLPTLTVAENVMLPMDFCDMYKMKERRARAVDLLAEVGVEEHADKLPSAMSGGQQQRVAVARALANDPPIVVADEPTGNLDSETAETVYRLFERLVEQDKTVLVVSHDPDLEKWVTRTVTLVDGRLVPERPEAQPEMEVGTGPPETRHA